MKIDHLIAEFERRSIEGTQIVRTPGGQARTALLLLDEPVDALANTLG